MEVLGFIEVCLIFSPIILIILGILGSKKENKSRPNYINRMKQFHGTENNNNRHSYMYQDVEKEIIKVDHTFSKEVFLTKAKEIFLKYKNDLVKGEIQELKGYITNDYMKIIQNKIEDNKKNNIKVVIENFHIYNAFLYGFSKSTDNQVITIKLKTDMRTYEINEETQYISKGNKYATVDRNYEMQFTRKPKEVKCQSCGAPVNIKDLSVCEYCNTPIEVDNNEWKLNYINILKD